MEIDRLHQEDYEGKGVEKIPGYSWMEVNGPMFEFAAFDKSHFESKRIYI